MKKDGAPQGETSNLKELSVAKCRKRLSNEINKDSTALQAKEEITHLTSHTDTANRTNKQKRVKA